VTIFGIEIKRPSFGELALLAGWTALISVIVTALNKVSVVPAEAVWPALCAVVGGSIVSAFGISIFKDGWRALVLIILAASLLQLMLILLRML
jgi:hypothetical protein